MKFKVGDKVKTRKCFHEEFPWKIGEIVKVYGKTSSLGYYDPELYDVDFGDGKIDKGRFPHGLHYLECSSENPNFYCDCEELRHQHCPNSKDGNGHCVHWWDELGPCCWCNDN